MECPRRRNITYKETGEIWFMTVRVMRFLPGMSRYFSSSIVRVNEVGTGNEVRNEVGTK